jgi:hypothetical protein
MVKSARLDTLAISTNRFTDAIQAAVRYSAHLENQFRNKWSRPSRRRHVRSRALS